MADKKVVNLRTVAEHVGLAPCSVSVVLNNSPAARAIPQATKDRIFRAAEELNYRPNLWARSLRTKRTRMVAVLAPDFGSAAVARVIASAQRRLHGNGYLLILGTLNVDGGGSACAQFQQRGVEGLIAVDAALPRHVDLPVASVDVGYLTVLHVTDAMHAWLSNLGESAADAIIRQIENLSPARVRVDAKFPPAFFELPEAGLAARESA